MKIRKWLLLCTLAVTLVSCERDTPTEKERTTLTSLTRTFLLALARSYSTMDPKPLEGLAAPRFINETWNAISTLKANDDRLQPDLIDLQITDIKVLRHANAYVFCTEVWDTKRFSVDGSVLKGHDPNSVLHSVIQLKKVERQWLVLYREVEETALGPRFLVRTPTPKAP